MKVKEIIDNVGAHPCDYARVRPYERELYTSADKRLKGRMKTEFSTILPGKKQHSVILRVAERKLRGGAVIVERSRRIYSSTGDERPAALNLPIDLVSGLRRNRNWRL